jgi:molecular chaperone IbpA
MTRLPTRIDSATLPDFVRYVANRTIGYDDMLNDFYAAAQQNTSNYPPYNLIRTGEDTYEITMAVAGFRKDDIQIEVTDRELTIASCRAMNELPEGAEVIHQGLAMRDFTRTFKLVEYIEVKGASLQDGILSVQLERIMPDAVKPKLIEIR